VLAPFDLWLDIVAGQVDGATAFMEGKYKIEGDLNLLIHMGEWFGER